MEIKIGDQVSVVWVETGSSFLAVIEAVYKDEDGCKLSCHDQYDCLVCYSHVIMSMTV